MAKKSAQNAYLSLQDFAYQDSHSPHHILHITLIMSQPIRITFLPDIMTISNNDPSNPSQIHSRFTEKYITNPYIYKEASTKCYHQAYYAWTYNTNPTLCICHKATTTKQYLVQIPSQIQYTYLQKKCCSYMPTNICIRNHKFYVTNPSPNLAKPDSQRSTIDCKVCPSTHVCIALCHARIIYIHSTSVEMSRTCTHLGVYDHPLANDICHEALDMTYQCVANEVLKTPTSKNQQYLWQQTNNF